MSIMEIKQVGYSYDNKKKVLKGVNAEMEQGKLYAILGPSGCGKTTLLSLIGGLDSPGSGQIYFDGQDIAKTGLSDHRKNHVAFIFQAYNLIVADEPTGNLDEDTAQDITEILKESAHKMNKCVVVVTHSNELAKQADVVFRLKKGELQVLERVQDGAAQSQSRRNNAPRSERRAH